jgi:hypothetical protein
VTLNHGPVETVGEREFLEVSKDIIFDFINREVGGGLERSFGESSDDISFIRNDRVEFVVDNLGVIELEVGLTNDINNGRGFLEGGDTSTNLVEGDGNVLTDSTAQLGLGLVTNNNEVSFGGFFQDNSTGSLGDTGVDTTTETTIGRRGDKERLGIFSRLGFSTGEKS